MSKAKMASVIKKIQRHKDAIANHRDALREILEDVEANLDATTDAVDQLGYAIDSLSQYQ